MPKRDGKSKFYRTLDLEKKDRELMRQYRKIVEKMKKDS